MRVLVVTSPFNGYGKGAVISDEKTIESVLASESAHRVIKADHGAVQSDYADTSDNE